MYNSNYNGNESEDHVIEIEGMLFRYAIIALSNYFEIQAEKWSPAKVIYCRMRFHSTVAICSFAETLSDSDDFIYSVYSTK